MQASPLAPARVEAWDSLGSGFASDMIFRRAVAIPFRLVRGLETRRRHPWAEVPPHSIKARGTPGPPNP
jgi:hypothetical protein